MNEYLDQLKDENIEIYVEPVSNDAGTAMGAAMLMHRRLTKDNKVQAQQETLYEGPAYCYSLNEIAKGFGEDYPIEYIEERKGEIKHSICDPTEAKELLDWETKNDVLDYINDTYL